MIDNKPFDRQPPNLADHYLRKKVLETPEEARADETRAGSRGISPIRFLFGTLLTVLLLCTALLVLPLWLSGGESLAKACRGALPYALLFGLPALAIAIWGLVRRQGKRPLYLVGGILVALVSLLLFVGMLL